LRTAHSAGLNVFIDRFLGTALYQKNLPAFTAAQQQVGFLHEDISAVL
jgi:hypothetical protein